LRAARKYEIATFLSTNGQKLNDERVIEALISEPPTYLIVAIDGLTDETNTKFRVGAKLTPILAGIQKIAAIKKKKGLTLPVLHMRYIVMKHNQHEVPQLQGFATTNAFDLLTVRTLSIIDTDSPDQRHGEFLPDMKDLRAYDYKNGARVEKKDFICQEPFWFPTVFADGTLVACEQDYNAQASLGVISKDVSFADLWYGKHAAQVRKVIRDAPNRLSFCRNCPYRDRSGTDCSVQAHFLNRNIPYSSLTAKPI
jgi:radical SAM protein with 4Fe4S-binding SPASM domain